MPENFRIAAERMHESSKQLHSIEHYHNASYLAGYVGECYMKLLVEQIRRVDNSLLKDPKKYGHNIAEMHGEVSSYIATASPALSYLGVYVVDMSVNCTELSRWKPEGRYNDGTLPWDTEEVSRAFQEEQERCFAQIVAMRISGLI